MKNDKTLMLLVVLMLAGMASAHADVSSVKQALDAVNSGKTAQQASANSQQADALTGVEAAQNTNIAKQIPEKTEELKKAGTQETEESETASEE